MRRIAAALAALAIVAFAWGAWAQAATTSSDEALAGLRAQAHALASALDDYQGLTTTATVPGPTQTVRVTATATVPGPTVTVTRRPTATVTATATVPGPTVTVTKPGPTVTVTASPSPSSPSPTSPSPTATSSGPVCLPGAEKLVFNGQGSAGLGQYGEGNYDASAELWGVSGYNYTQKMGVCSHSSWYVDVTTDNSKGDGAVKAYPSMRRFYHDWGSGFEPLLSSFPRMKVAFASTDPAVCPGCIYDTAFDIWLNNYRNELMIWTHNVAQRPAGSVRASGIQLDGHTWTLWTTNDNSILSFVPSDTDYIGSGTMDVKAFTDYLTGAGRIPAATTVGQVSFGVEIVSTNSVSRHWDFAAFTVDDGS